MPQLLLELFSEEIPARMQTNAARDLERMARERLTAAGFGAATIRSFAGPRRLTLVVDDLPAAQENRDEEVKGPRVGAPPQAMDGFLKKVGLAQSDLVERDGVYYAVQKITGRPTTEIIAEMVDAIVRSFPWPKSMKWGTGSLRWVRPLQRILCVFDQAVVPFSVDGLQSGNLTEGHRFMGPDRGQPFAVTDFKSYEDALDAHFVVIEVEERKRRILDGARDLCIRTGLELVEDEGLLEEVAGLAEWPTPILGDMDPSFLDLPPEVIRTSMRTHQKYFAVRDPATGKLAPHFLVVANIEAIDGGAAVAAGNARVLSARLNDARFFWDEDRKVGFEPWLEKLNGVTFHAKLGTMKERVDRIVFLSGELSRRIAGVNPASAKFAAQLSKADLASGMVGEFPELQGLMGRYYALSAASPERLLAAKNSMFSGLSSGGLVAVTDALRDHYKPLGPSDSVPTEPTAAVVALADKLDTLVGFFLIDEKPTGTRDPYALRRAALGLIRVVISHNARISLKHLCYLAVCGYLGQSFDLVSKLTNDLDGEDADRILSAIAAINRLPIYSQLKSLESHKEMISEIKSMDPEFIDGSVIRESVWFVTVSRIKSFALQQHARLYEDTTKEYLEILGDYKPDQALPGVFEVIDGEIDKVRTFLADRLKVLLRDQGKRHDLVDAVFALGDDDLVRIVARVDALDAFLTTDDGVNLLAGYKRATNILRAEEKKGAVPTGAAQVGLSGQPAEEAALATAVQAAQTAVEPLLAAEDFAGAMAALARLRGPVDAFFEKVLVNSDVAAERENRLKLLGQVRDLMGRVADFSLIGG